MLQPAAALTIATRCSHAALPSASLAASLRCNVHLVYI